MNCKKCKQRLNFFAALSVAKKPTYNAQYYCSEKCANLYKEEVRQGAKDRVAAFLLKTGRPASEPLPFPNGKPENYDVLWEEQAEMSLNEWEGYLDSLE